MNTKQADQLFVQLYRLLMTSANLPIRLNARRCELEPFYLVREECIETLRDMCGGDSWAETLRQVRTRVDALKMRDLPVCGEVVEDQPQGGEDEQ